MSPRKVQVTLTEQEVKLLKDYGAEFGYRLPKIIRHTISSSVEKIIREKYASHDWMLD